VLDALSDPTREETVLMASAQVGKTLMLKAVLGYFIDQDPSPILVVQPTLEIGEAFSKDRLAPMVRDTPRLRGKIDKGHATQLLQTIRPTTLKMLHGP